jgi:hypothetical protein
MVILKKSLIIALLMPYELLAFLESCMLLPIVPYVNTDAHIWHSVAIPSM